MQLVEIARFEIDYRLRRATTWFFAVLLILLPLVVLQALASEPQHLNAPLSTATATAIALIGSDLARDRRRGPGVPREALSIRARR
jgi:hypothetical protein